MTPGDPGPTARPAPPPTAQRRPVASAGRRWTGRIIDAVLVLLVVLTVLGVTMVLQDQGRIGIDLALGLTLGTYLLVLIVFGGLYGRQHSPGQAIAGVVSVQMIRQNRVGFWRGIGRYLAVGFFPVLLVALVLSLFSGGPALDGPRAVEVVRR